MEQDRTLETAERLLITWLGSPNFKESVLVDTMVRNTELGQRLKELGKDTSTAAWDERRLVYDLINSALRKAEEMGWIKRGYTHLGRNPVNEPRWDEYGWAAREEDRLDRTNRRARFVMNGPKYSTLLITVTDKFIGYLADQQNQLAELDGLTRQEAAEKLDAPQAVVNKLVKALIERGWTEQKVRTPDGPKQFKRVLRVP